MLQKNWTNNFRILKILSLTSLALVQIHMAFAIEHYEKGPVSDSEHQILTQDLYQLHTQPLTPQHCQNSLATLERLVHRYPSQRSHGFATWTLGVCLVHLKRDRAAIPHLKSVISRFDKTGEGITARIWLGEAYLREGLAQEALLLAQELLTKFYKNPADNFEGENPDPGMAKRKIQMTEVGYAALVIKARALQLKKLYSRAEQTLRAVKSTIPNFNRESELKEIPSLYSPLHQSWQNGFYYFVELEQKLNECRKYIPTQGSEALVLDQFEKLGTCINEGLVWVQRGVEAPVPDLDWSATQIQSLQNILKSEATFSKVPPKATQKFKNAKQKSQYTLELSQHLQQNLKAKILARKINIEAWKTKSTLTPQIQTLLNSLERGL